MAERQKRESKTYENQTERESQPGDLKSGKGEVKQVEKRKLRWGGKEAGWRGRGQEKKSA